jgi:hypothetical protein
MGDRDENYVLLIKVRKTDPSDLAKLEVYLEEMRNILPPSCDLSPGTMSASTWPPFTSRVWAGNRSQDTRQQVVD